MSPAVGTLPRHPSRDADPMLPRGFTVSRRRQDTADTATVWLEPADGSPFSFVPGQFTMLQAFGVGEIPISISGDPAESGVLQHTVRDVGAVSRALAGARVGTRLGVRGPFGTGWDVDTARGRDLVVVAGGIGLAPLRPALLEISADRDAFGSVSLLYGARTPGDMLFTGELLSWATERRINVQVTVDSADDTWHGRVGLVTALLERAEFDPARTTALVCGPEVMMRHTATALLDSGISAVDVRLSMERSMKCGIGLCGHCQLRELFICRDGPVLGYDVLAPLLVRGEL
ncbi:MAG: FAD/NAD(P)-binding protein [Nocardioides sp.]